MAKKGTQPDVTLACEVCKERNYRVNKSRGMAKQGKGAADRLSLQKFCASCRKHTLHKEAK